MKKMCMWMLAAVVFLCGCHAGSEKEQYAVIQNCEDGTVFTLTPDHKNYDEVVEKFAYAAVEEKQEKIPGEAVKLKSIVFYQAPTETIFASDSEDSMNPLIEIDLYVDGDTQYAAGYLSFVDSISFSFQMPKDLTELIASLENP